MFHRELLAPHRPALVENRVGKKTAQAAGVLKLDHKLQVVAGVGFMDGREFQAVVLADFGKFFIWIFLIQTQVVHPEDAGLVFGKWLGRAVGGRGKLVL